MNSKIKKFYYTTHKSNESKYIHFLFRNMVLLIEACKINDIIYIFVIFLNLIQSISISLELSNELKTHSKIKKYSRFFHFCNFLTKEYFSEESFKAFNILNLIIIILPIFLFYFISYKKPKKLINITIYVLSYLFFIDKYILLTYNFCIIFSPYIIKNNNFEENEYDSDSFILTFKVINIFLLIIKIPIIYIILFLFNNYSIFQTNLPWSGPYNYISPALIIMKFYILLSGYFFHKITFLNLFIILSISIFVFISRMKCPYFYRRKLNNFTIFCEGVNISFSTLYTIITYFNKNWLEYDLIYMLLFCIFLGILYLVIISIFDYNVIKNFNNKMTEYIYLNEVNQYEIYIFLCRIISVIKESKHDKKSSNLIFMFYSQHKIECSDLNCYCNKIEELILNKKLDLRDTSQIDLDNNNENQVDLELESLIINDKDIIDDSYSNSKIGKREKHIKLWGYLIENIIEKAINISISNKSQDYIRIDFANFLSYYLDKYVRSLIEISYVNKNTLPFHFQFYMFDCKNKLLEVNQTKELFEKESDKNFFKILEYNRNYEKFLKIIKDTSELSVNFWSEMEKNVFQPKIFEKRGFEICKSTTKLEKYSKLILTNNPYDIRTLKIYGTFLNHVLKLSDESKIYLDKAFLQLIMSVDEIEKNNNNLNNDSMKNFFQNQIDSSIIVVNGNKENIGRIEYVNYAFTNIFGFSKDEIIGKNVSTIMPSNIGKYHNQFMLNFYTTTKAKFINETRREIGLNKERLIYPIMIYVKIFPCIEEGISYIGLIQKTTFNGLTKGPRHTERSNNIGYIMTTLDDKLIHYNNVIESKFGLVPNLMYDDTKDKTEEFKIEMIFPELLVIEDNSESEEENNINEIIKMEEKRLFFTTKVIEASKRSQFSKLYSIVKSELEKYKKTVEKINKDNLKNKGISETKFMLNNERINIAKKIHKKKNIVSLSNKLENNEYIRKNTAIVSVTEFSYILNAQFLIYQIIFEKNLEQNITNVIKQYQQKFLMMTDKNKLSKDNTKTKNQTKTINNNYFSGMLSIGSTMTTGGEFTTTNKKGVLFSVIASVRTNTFNKKSPLTLNILSITFLVMFLIIILNVFCEFSLNVIRTNQVSKSLNITFKISQIYESLYSLENLIILYGLSQLNVFNKSNVYFNENQSNIYLNQLNQILSFMIQIRNSLVKSSKYDSELNYNLTEKTYQFFNYYSQENYSVSSQTLVNSITILVNNYNNLIDIFTNYISYVNVDNIIKEIENKRNNYSEYELNVLKSLNTILTNGEKNIARNFLEIILNLLSKNREYAFINFRKILFIFFIITIFCSCVFLFLYIFLYLNLINLRINILKIFTEISEETEEKCMKEVLNYNNNIEKIIQSDVFFLENYFEGFGDNSKIKDSSSVNLPNVNNFDFNLGLEPDPTYLKEVFSKYKKQELVSIKQYIEEQKEIKEEEHNNQQNNKATTNNKNQNTNNVLISNNNDYFDSNNNKFGGRKSEIFNLKNNHRPSFLSNTGQLVILNESMRDNNNLITNPIGKETEEKFLVDDEKNMTINYRKRMIHKRSQIKKIESYHKTKYFDLTAIIIFIVLMNFFILWFIFPYQIFKNLKNVLKQYHSFLHFKIYLTKFLPGINLLITQGDIFSEIYLEEFKNISNNIIELFNGHTIFFLENKKKYSNLFNHYLSIKNGNSTCLYIKEYYEEKNTIDSNQIYNMCIEGFFRKGEELGVYEYTSVSMNLLNYIYENKNNLISVEERKNIINNNILLNGIDYVNFIITPFYYEFIEIFIESISSKIKGTQNIFLVKIFCGVIVGSGILFLYFKFLRKKYLNKYIYTKAMIMLIPQNELLKGEHYAVIQNLLGNER